MNSRLPRLTPALILVTAATLLATLDRSGAADATASDARGASKIASLQNVSPDPHPGEPTVGDKLLLQSIAQLERRSSVYARLRHQSSIGGQELYGVGAYWQQGGGDDLRVRWELQIAGQDASLLQVSTNRFLWIDRKLPTGRNVSRVDLRQLRADASWSAAAGELQPGEAAWTTARPELLAHCGGLPSLLTRLVECFSFLPPQAMRLATQASEDASSSVSVFAVVGHWKREKLAALVGDDAERSPAGERPALSPLRAVPDRLPQEVLVLVGQEDLFPYRIEYRDRQTPVSASGDGLPVPYQLSARPLVVLEFAEVGFDIPIATGHFDYTPGDADWVDYTTTALERLRRERQQELAVRAGADRR